MKKLILIFAYLMLSSNAFATDQVVDLVVGYKNVNFAGKTVRAIAVNNQIPAPTLHFKEGDQVTINVHNQLAQATAVHWHGIILPWQMDGVAGITQKAIKPGEIFQYKFTLEQSGTYWYHAHAGLQEQQGLYGAFIVDPQQKSRLHYSKDYVIVLSDWSNTHPDQILKNLKKQGDYYSPRFPLQPSLAKFIHDYRQADPFERKNVLDDYKMMQQMRMSIYDINDIAYDQFLLNGHPKAQPWTAPVKVGDTVRLRFIGAAANTIFQVKLPNAEMEMVHVQGNDIKPYPLKDFTIAPGETYDLLVKIKKNSPTIIYAESTDQIGAIYGALITAPDQQVDYQQVQPFPEALPVTREMMSYGMMHHGMNHNMMHGTDHKMAAVPQISKTKYKHLQATVKTNDPDKPIYKTINMELDGWMDRFIWFINGVPEHEAAPIILEPNKRYRLVLKNTSMMHHPMHIHGHWFIVRNDHGAYDPLLHTIDMPPGATIIADIDADESGQWLFHCHLLYHMMSGMARVFQYSSLIEITEGASLPQNIIEKTPFHNRPIVRVDALMPIDPALVEHPMAHPKGFYFANFLEVGADPFNNVQRVTFKGLYGPDYNKLELFTNDAEIKHGTIENADLDIFYWHLIDQFWAIKAGVNYFYRPSETSYVQPGIGIEGLMPYFIGTQLRGYYHDGSVKIDLEFGRDTQITNNFFIKTAIRGILATKTITEDEIGSGLNQMRYILAPYYRIMPGLNLVMEYEYEREYGALKKIRRDNGESSSDNTLTFGVSVIF
jgi:FtsP/CotA-like multicopper oxidase with cupredoxin domain